MTEQHSHDNEKAQKLQDLLGLPSKNTKKPEVDAATDDGSQAPPPVAESDPPPSSKEEKKINVQLDREKILRALWTIASVISMTVTIVVLILVAVLYRYVKYFPVDKIQTLAEEKTAHLPPDLDIEEVGAITEKAIDNMPEEVGLNTPLDLLKGLYDNFELMDNASIETTILVEDEIPVQFTLKLDEETTVVLSEAVTIPGARVALTTGGLNIFNAPATVTLPAGTELPISLALEVPVDEMIPVTLNVPVNIPLNETDLHEPFVGLQKVVEPLYCLINPEAMNAKGEFICSEKTIE